MKRTVIKLNTFTLYAVDKVTSEFTFILSVHANTLKSAKQYTKGQVLELNRKFPHHHYSFVWEQDNV